MLKKTITYKTYDDVEVTEDFYFNLTKAELLEMEITQAGTFTKMVDRIVKAKDGPTIARIFKDLIKKSYGIKSPDGKRFQKSKEIWEAFEQCPAYSELYIQLSTDDNAASEFIQGLIPKDLQAELANANEAKKLTNNTESNASII